MVRGTRHVNLLVMVRLADGEIQKIRTFSRDCELDAGGLPVYWWSSVNPGQSMDFLETLVRQERSTKMAESAVQAIAHHATPRADEMLEDFASDRREDVAEQAIFWLGQSGDQRALAFFEKILLDK